MSYSRVSYLGAKDSPNMIFHFFDAQQHILQSDSSSPPTAEPEQKFVESYSSPLPSPAACFPGTMPRKLLGRRERRGGRNILRPRLDTRRTDWGREREEESMAAEEEKSVRFFGGHPYIYLFPSKRNIRAHGSMLLQMGRAVSRNVGPGFF